MQHYNRWSVASNAHMQRRPVRLNLFDVKTRWKRLHCGSGQQRQQEC
jgi:hypothetical protein